MYDTLKPVLEQELKDITVAGLYKTEWIIITPQGADIKLQGGKEVINFCANNYLGLSSHPKVVAASEARHRHTRIWNVIGAIYLWHTGHS